MPSGKWARLIVPKVQEVVVEIQEIWWERRAAWGNTSRCSTHTCSRPLSAAWFYTFAWETRRQLFASLAASDVKLAGTRAFGFT